MNYRQKFCIRTRYSVKESAVRGRLTITADYCGRVDDVFTVTSSWSATVFLIFPEIMGRGLLCVGVTSLSYWLALTKTPSFEPVAAQVGASRWASEAFYCSLFTAWPQYPMHTPCTSFLRRNRRHELIVYLIVNTFTWVQESCTHAPGGWRQCFLCHVECVIGSVTAINSINSWARMKVRLLYLS